MDGLWLDGPFRDGGTEPPTTTALWMGKHDGLAWLASWAWDAMGLDWGCEWAGGEWLGTGRWTG